MTKKKNNLTLEQLDAYAKTLTSKQVNMLYENRMKTKYTEVKALNEAESMIPSRDEYFVVFVPKVAFIENGDNNIQLTYAVCANKDNIKHVILPQTGVYFYTGIPADYEYAIRKLVEMGYGEYIKDSVEPDYLYIIDEAEASAE